MPSCGFEEKKGRVVGGCVCECARARALARARASALAAARRARRVRSRVAPGGVPASLGARPPLSHRCRTNSVRGEGREKEETCAARCSGVRRCPRVCPRACPCVSVGIFARGGPPRDRPTRDRSFRVDRFRSFVRVVLRSAFSPCVRSPDGSIDRSRTDGRPTRIVVPLTSSLARTHPHPLSVVPLVSLLPTRR